MNNEEKFDALFNMVSQLKLAVTEIQNNISQQPLHPYQHLDSEHGREDKTVRIDVHEFDGTTHDPEVYIEWEKGVERYFEFKDTHPEHQYKIAKVKLVKLAATWLEGLQRQRARKDKPKIHSWEKLRKHLRRKYIPTNYKHLLYAKWINLKQGVGSVAEYIREGERLTVLCEKNEPEERKIARFLRGLREDLREKIEVMQNLTYEGACTSALILEKSARRKAAPPTHTLNRSKETSTYKQPTQQFSEYKGTQQHRPSASHSKQQPYQHVHTLNKTLETSSYKLITQNPTDGNRTTAQNTFDLRQTAQHSSKIRETQQHAPIVKTIHVDNVEINNPPLQASSTCTTLHVDNVEMNGFYFIKDEITQLSNSRSAQPYLASINPYTARQLTAKEQDMNPKDVIPPTKAKQTPTQLLGRKECDAKDDSVRHITKTTFYATIKLHRILQSISSYKDSKFLHTLLSDFCIILPTKQKFSIAWYPHMDDQRNVTTMTLVHILKTLVEKNNTDWSENLAHTAIAYSRCLSLIFKCFQCTCMNSLNSMTSTTLVHLSLQDNGAWNTRKQLDTAQIQTAADAHTVDAASSHDVSPYHTNIELRTILFQEGGIEPNQEPGSEGTNEGQGHPRNTSNFMGNTLEVFESTLTIRDSTSTSNKDFQFKGSEKISKGNQRQQSTSTASQGGTAHATDQNKSDNQQLFHEPADQATLMDVHRCKLNRCDDLEGIIGISTLGPSHHGPRVPRMIMESIWKSKAKVAQSTGTANQNMQQLLTIEQATLESSPRRDPNPLDDVEHRVGISAQGPSHHDPRALLKVIGKTLKSEYKVA
ncbi:uncharacterized protein LOC130824739 [Amaranthus tricolor]|uniref:uncharacterized protein LOC130824739 n=1 Tax=Amaranthus tricolor TaxID=29722 RepID=UPI00258733F1|nr:uncharacterized protein LOC130824739 [Amaranthus tricolor]